MTPLVATSDAIDRGFLRRLADRAQAHAAPPAQEKPVAAAAAGIDRPGDGPASTGRGPAVPAVVQPIDPGPAATLVERLLHAAPQAWAAIAQRVEDAHRDGASVIAVAGARRGEGRTTVVQCLARTLAARGRRVECHDRAPIEGPHLLGRDGGPVVLVDAGIWFPSGPFRRSWFERVSLGCHAAILVRRSDQPACAARGAAIESTGLKLLGEVLTMVPAAVAGAES